MKAIQLTAIDTLSLVEAPLPQPGPGQMLVRTRAATICTSDINDMRGNPFGIALPVILGHEGAGVVSALGPDVTGFRVGDRVATSPVHSCGKCAACREGNPHLCLDMGHFGINMPGTFAGYYLVGQQRAVKLAPEVDFVLAALAEPVSVCLEALALARLEPGQSLLILGDGPFGLIMARLAQRMRLGRVVIAGMQSFRLAFAPLAALALNLTGLPDPPRRALQGLAPGSGYDAVILAVGSAQAFADGLACLKPKGRLVVFSALPGDTPVDLFTVHLKELEILGACNERDRFVEAVGLLGDPVLNLRQLVTQSFPLEAYAEAFRLAEFGKDRVVKVAFEMGG